MLRAHNSMRKLQHITALHYTIHGSIEDRRLYLRSAIIREDGTRFGISLHRPFPIYRAAFPWLRARDARFYGFPIYPPVQRAPGTEPIIMAPRRSRICSLRFTNTTQFQYVPVFVLRTFFW